MSASATRSVDGAKAAIVDIVAPTMGVVLFVLMTISPTRTVWRTRQKRDIGEFNPLPTVMLICSGVAWFGYAVVTSDPFIFCSSSTALLVSMGSTIILAGQMRQQTRDRLTITLLCFLLVLLLLGALSTLAGWPYSTVKTVWAVAANVAAVLYYSSLPSTVIKVVRQRSSASIHLGNSIMAGLNCTLWLIYFVVAKGEYIVPTTTYYLGVSFSVLNCFLCWLYPRTLPASTAGEGDHAGGSGRFSAADRQIGDSMALGGSSPGEASSALEPAEVLEGGSGLPSLSEPKQRFTSANPGSVHGARSESAAASEVAESLPEIPAGYLPTTFAGGR